MRNINQTSEKKDSSPPQNFFIIYFFSIIMKPPHWLCKNCGIIINDSGREPNPCRWCNHEGFYYLGYEGEYNSINVRAEHNLIFDPTKFTPDMQHLYWGNMSEAEKLNHQSQIDELNKKIEQRKIELYLR